MSSKTILYIEGNEDNAYMLSCRLRKKGFKVVISPNGKEGIEAAQELLPDLILMDLTLPGIGGHAGTKILKSTELTAAIPVIVLSSHVLPDERENSRAAGSDDYETKPIVFERLLKKIYRHTEKTSTEAPPRSIVH